MSREPNKNAKVTPGGAEVADWQKVLRDNAALIQRIRELPTQPTVAAEDDEPSK
jgi:hypothetical protein